MTHVTYVTLKDRMAVNETHVPEVLLSYWWHHNFEEIGDLAG